ncbi:MAG: flagellar biosynthesis protein FlgM [Planctomycetota bacterium]|nr:MAG: flagellar biosynthesis protein FlgM [Planctomycetota bacterium]
MRWEGRRQSTNVEDRRQLNAAPVLVGGGLFSIVLLIALLFLGVDPQQIAAIAPILVPQPAQRPPAEQAAGQPVGQPADDAMKQFVAVVLADNEDVWGKLFPRYFQSRYVPPTLVLFTGQVNSACGFASAAVGPFYCPLDKKVYIDLAFYEDLKDRFGAPGDFAQAYVIAHEIGHHVQNQLGISAKVQALRERLSKRDANTLSVRMELQADFLAGVWAHHVARYAGIVDEEDIREAVNAAAAIGDDRIQKQWQGYVVPDAFTHGSSEQRVRWFLAGLKSGDPTLMERAFEVDNP